MPFNLRILEKKIGVEGEVKDCREIALGTFSCSKKGGSR